MYPHGWLLLGLWLATGLLPNGWASPGEAGTGLTGGFPEGSSEIAPGDTLPRRNGEMEALPAWSHDTAR